MVNVGRLACGVALRRPTFEPSPANHQFSYTYFEIGATEEIEQICEKKGTKIEAVIVHEGMGREV